MNDYIEKEIAIENSNLKEVWFSNHYAMIHSILRDNQNVGSVIIPNPVKKICNFAFSRCYELTSVSLPESLCFIGSGAFNCCRKLKSIIIPQNVTELGGDDAFSGCWELTSVTILGCVLPKFRFCRKISTITIGENLDNINPNAFNDCKNIKSIVVDQNNKYFDSRNNCNAIIETKTDTLLLACNSTTIPDGIKHISSRAFWNCGRIKTLSLPNSLETIERLPDNVTKIIVPKGRKQEFKKKLPWTRGFVLEEK